MKTADPFAALVDFMAFMVLISVFMFIISESNVPLDRGSKANVISFRITTKSATAFSQKLLATDGAGKPTTDVEFSLWLLDDRGKARLAEQVFDQLVVRTIENQSSVFGVTPDEAPKGYLLSISHLEKSELIGVILEMAIDVQIGKKSCSVDWSGQLGIDAGAIINIEQCSAS